MNIQNKQFQTGISLVELMIAVTLGLLVVLGLTVIVVGNVRSADEVERANQQTENGRYALQLLTDEMRNAGYFAEFNLTLMSVPKTKPDPCSTTLAGLNMALPIIVQGYYRAAKAPTCLTDIKANTEILVVRRVSTCAIGDPGCDTIITNAPYFQASACASTTELGSSSGSYSTNFYALDTNVANLTRHLKDCKSLAPIHQFITRIYFIANNDKGTDGIPTLKRAELGNPALPDGFTIVPIVEGIDDLHFEYGIDNLSSPTGSPLFFTADPDSYNTCTATTTPTCTAYWQNTVAAKIHLLSRNVTPTAGYSSNKTYAMGLDPSGNAIIDGPIVDSYKRHLYETTVRLNNTAARNSP